MYWETFHFNLLFFYFLKIQVYLALYTTIVSMADQVTKGTPTFVDTVFLSSLKVNISDLVLFLDIYFYLSEILFNWWWIMLY